MPVETELLDPAYLASIEDYSLLTRIVVDGALPGIHRSQRHGRGSEFFQYREYSRGDDLKLIDWKIFAKRGELVAKSYHEDTNLTCYLVVDASASMGYQGSRAACDKLRYASMLAACFAYVANRQGDRVGLFAYSDEVKEWIQPRSGGAHLNRVFTALAGLEAEGSNDHEFAWDVLSGGLPGRCLVVFLSDFLEAENELPERLRFAMSARYECLCLQILDPDEFDLPNSEALRFSEMEGTKEISTSPPAIREEYATGMNGFLESLKANLASVSVEFDSLSTDAQLGPALHRFLGMRYSSL
jgi:uncharacterized protein (DUF58 family)